jgi:pyridoxamine 5'-phosphate oxidase
MDPKHLFDMRKEYARHTLDEASVEQDPVVQFGRWFDDATQSGIEEINAMTLATVSPDGMADARTVLLKGFDHHGFVFFTNYNSQKSIQLDHNPNCCLLFHWKELERQVRIRGIAAKISAHESLEYFNARPDGSKIGAWASPQSTIVAGKAWLEETFNYYRERFKHGEIPKPPHWGGYRVQVNQIEFWQGRPNRMHDRIQYSGSGDGKWKIERLAP